MKILILGAGGHARVISEIVSLLGHEVTGFLDDNFELIGKVIAGIKVLDKIDAFQNYSFDQLIMGIGSNRVRHKLRTEQFKAVYDDQWFTAIHPKAIISKSAKIGVGVAIMAGAVINCDAIIQNHTILNTSSTIDHDCIIGDYAHIAPGVNLAGGVSVGKGTLIGIGSCAIPYTHIGEWVTVGAGATVVNDVDDNLTVVGTPARPLIN